MNVDLAVLIVLVLCFFAGVLRGFLRQLVSFAALLIGLGGAWIAGWGLRAAGRGTVISGAAFIAAASTVLFIVIYAASLRVGRNWIRERALGYHLGFGDRVLGGVCALAKGLIVILLGVWILGALESEWATGHPRAAMLWHRSSLVAFARDHNPLADLRPTRRIRGFLVAVRNPEAKKRLHGQPAYARIVLNPRYRAVRDDVKLEQAVRRGDVVSVVMDRRLYALAADESFRRDFISVGWEAAIEPQAGAPPLTSLPAPPLAVPAATPVMENPPGAAALSTVILKRGTALRGAIVSEDADGVVVDVSLDGGVIRTLVSREEIDRIEPPAPIPVVTQ